MTSIAALLSAIAAALAAGASWRVVVLTSRARQPELHAQLLVNDGIGYIDITIRNLGGGTAMSSTFMLEISDFECVGYVHDGFIVPGAGYRIATEIPAGAVDIDEAHALVLTWRDASGLVRAGADDGRRTVFRSRFTRRRLYPPGDRVFGFFFPDRTGREGLRQVSYKAERLQSPGI